MTYSFKNSVTKATEVSVLPSTGATIVESSAYLNNAGKPSYVISRSLRKINIKEEGDTNTSLCGTLIDGFPPTVTVTRPKLMRCCHS